MSETDLSIRGISDDFKIKPGREKFETVHYWVQVSIKKDSKRRDNYIDVLFGKKHEKNEIHLHLGIDRDQRIRFIEPRNILKSIRREIDSKKRGRLADDTRFFNSRSDKARLTFKVIIDDKNKTIDLQFPEKTLSEIARAIPFSK